jgi:hypothetical protein
VRASTLLIVLTMAVPLSTGAQQPKWSGLPPVLLGAVREIQPPEGRGSWVVQVISRGGLDGRGEGDLAISSDGSLTAFTSGASAVVSPDALSSLGQRVRTATPTQWTGVSRLGTCSDCVATLLVLTLRDSDGPPQTYTAFWDATTRASVPVDLLRIHDLARTLQRR